VQPVVPINVWVDDDAHVRRVEEELQVKDQTIDMSDKLSD
jgi:hypothetical protein